MFDCAAECFVVERMRLLAAVFCVGHEDVCDFFFEGCKFAGEFFGDFVDHDYFLLGMIFGFSVRSVVDGAVFFSHVSCPCSSADASSWFSVVSSLAVVVVCDVNDFFFLSWLLPPSPFSEECIFDCFAL